MQDDLENLDMIAIQVQEADKPAAQKQTKRPSSKHSNRS